MNLITINTAHYAGPTPEHGINCEVVCELDGVTETIPFHYSPSDPHGMAPDVSAWFMANPEFLIQPFIGPEPEPEPEPVNPNTVPLPRREFRRALLHFGMTTADIVSIINSISDPFEREEMTIWWEDTQLFLRNYPVLLSMIDAAGLTEQQADEIWAYGVDLLNSL